ncbi:MAG: MBOAT family protein, partial [Lachnospiraceae bacterium]|nr:MBOAT family protein [Lachnospiraceae bacterium]
TYNGIYLVVATMFFAIQIYCDFAGYSIIAMGAAKMLGINLMDNFDAPYLSISVAEFWRKWHISLTSWFKDYLYIPLGGSKKGKVRKYINKLIVFLISGLWHGAQFSFVAWGGVNGLYQIASETSKPLRDKIVYKFGLNRNSITHKLLHITGTFVLVDFSWIFFRAARFKEAFIIIRQMFSVYNPWVIFDGSIYNCGLDSKNFWLLLICLLILLFADCCKYKKIQIREVIMRQDSWFQVLFISFSVLTILVFGIYGSGYNQAAFIYFQF